uniref:DUF4220 domain-containing protein n=1 Tax=Oryza punctata TaxID=4537 RepID=A0A0E0M8W0_ORYPU
MELLFVVVVMAILGSMLYINGFVQIFFPWLSKSGLHHLSLGRFNFSAVVRFLLHYTFFQFVPLVSATFSRSGGLDQRVARRSYSEILLMLLWLLLVELIRKKVQAMQLMPTDGSSFSRSIGRFKLIDYAYELNQLVWVGFLIFTNLQPPPETPWPKAYAGAPAPAPPPSDSPLWLLIIFFVVLWSLCFAKMVLSLVNRKLATGSWHTARNPLLIAAYMQKIMEKQPRTSSDAEATLSTCKFVVMGEDRLVLHYEKEKEKEKEKSSSSSNDNDNKKKAITTHGFGYGVGRRVDQAAGAVQPQQQMPYYCDQNEQKHVHLRLTDPNEYEHLGLKDPREKGRLVTVDHIMSMHEKHPTLFKGRRRQLLEDLCLSFSLFKMLRRRFEHYPMAEVGSDMARTMMLDGLLKLKVYQPDGKLQNLCYILINKFQRQVQRPFQVLRLELDLVTNYYQQAAAPVVMSQPILFTINFVTSALFLNILIAAVVYILFVVVGVDESESLYCRIYGDTKYATISSFCITVFLVLTAVAIETHEFWTVHVFSNWNIVRMVCIYCRAGHRRWLRGLYFLIIWIRFFTFSSSKTDMLIYQVSIFDACGPVDKISPRTSHVPLPTSATGRIIEALLPSPSSAGIVSRSTGIISLPDMEGLDLRKMSTTEMILACHLATELLDKEHDDKHQKKKEEDDREIASVLSKPLGEAVARFRCGAELFNRLSAGKDDKASFDEAWAKLARFWVHLLIYLAPSNDVTGHAKALASWGSGDLITCLWALCTHAGLTRQPPELTVVNDDDHRCQPLIHGNDSNV